jgi:ABC-type phosphate transport system substrate-binding protein
MKLRMLGMVSLLAALTACGASQGGSPASGPSTAAATTASSVPPPAVLVAVPAVVGKRLVEATSVLTAAGFTTVKPVDATGQDRVVVNPQNWIVRTQEPVAGTRVSRQP